MDPEQMLGLFKGMGAGMLIVWLAIMVFKCNQPLFMCLGLMLLHIVGCHPPDTPSNTPTPPVFAPSEWVTYTNSDRIYAMAFDGEGMLWAATNGGIVKWNLERNCSDLG